jgi:hypothetical protein
VHHHGKRPHASNETSGRSDGAGRSAEFTLAYTSSVNCNTTTTTHTQIPTAPAAPKELKNLVEEFHHLAGAYRVQRGEASEADFKASNCQPLIHAEYVKAITDGAAMPSVHTRVRHEMAAEEARAGGDVAATESIAVGLELVAHSAKHRERILTGTFDKSLKALVDIRKGTTGHPLDKATVAISTHAWVAGCTSDHGIRIYRPELGIVDPLLTATHDSMLAAIDQVETELRDIQEFLIDDCATFEAQNRLEADRQRGPHRTPQRPDRRHEALQHRRNQPDTRSTTSEMLPIDRPARQWTKAKILTWYAEHGIETPRNATKAELLAAAGADQGQFPKIKSATEENASPPRVGFQDHAAHMRVPVCVAKRPPSTHRFTDSNVSTDLWGGSIPQRGHDPHARRASTIIGREERSRRESNGGSDAGCHPV